MTDRMRDWVVGTTLRQQARTRPDAVYAEMTTGGSITYGEIDADADRIAVALDGLGIGVGDHVLVMMRNSLAFLQCWLGIMRRGAVIVPVNTAFRGDFLEFIVNDSGARLMVVDADLLPVVEASLERVPALRTLCVVGAGEIAPAQDGCARVAFADWLAGPSRDLGVALTMRDPAAILYTSGTTGRSKGALLPHGHQRLDPHVYIEKLGLTCDDTVYCCLPLFHANGLLLQAYGALILGARLVLAPAFSASGWLDDIRRHRATVTNLLGAMTEFVWRQPERPDDADTALRIACVVPVPKSFGPDFARRFGIEMVELYGATEINCPIFMDRADGLRPGCCGRAVEEFFDLVVADPDTDFAVPDGEVGELLVRPKVPWTVMLDYYNNPQATVRAWRNGWFHTGDAMRREPDGTFVFVDRLKDCLRRRGENISSFEVEQVILACDGVAEVAVVGVPSLSDEHEQEVMAFVVARPGSALRPEAVAAHCARRMPAFAVPRYVELVPALPKTETQKIRKQELRQAGVGPGTWENPEVGRPRQKGRAG